LVYVKVKFMKLFYCATKSYKPLKTTSLATLQCSDWEHLRERQTDRQRQRESETERARQRERERDVCVSSIIDPGHSNEFG